MTVIIALAGVPQAASPDAALTGSADQDASSTFAAVLHNTDMGDQPGNPRSPRSANDSTAVAWPLRAELATVVGPPRGDPTAVGAAEDPSGSADPVDSSSKSIPGTRLRTRTWAGTPDDTGQDLAALAQAAQYVLPTAGAVTIIPGAGNIPLGSLDSTTIDTKARSGRPEPDSSSPIIAPGIPAVTTAASAAPALPTVTEISSPAGEPTTPSRPASAPAETAGPLDSGSAAPAGTQAAERARPSTPVNPPVVSPAQSPGTTATATAASAVQRAEPSAVQQLLQGQMLSAMGDPRTFGDAPRTLGDFQQTSSSDQTDPRTQASKILAPNAPTPVIPPQLDPMPPSHSISAQPDSMTADVMPAQLLLPEESRQSANGSAAAQPAAGPGQRATALSDNSTRHSSAALDSAQLLAGVATAPVSVQSAVPTVAPTTPTANAPLYQQLAEPVLKLRASGDGTHRIVIDLHPRDLGPVSVELRMRNGEISVALASSNEATRATIAAALPQLHQQLSDAGMSGFSLGVESSSIGFSSGGAAGGQSSAQQRTAWMPSLPADPAGPVTPDLGAPRLRTGTISTNGMDRWL